ncbi:MAG: ABC transporter permease, partial [Bacteroidetes bacterium]|nr:ABC transporter permease [Bacteroidota bacterium]
MKELIYSFQSEWIKTKNSFIVWLTISGALFIPVLILISRLVQHSNTAMMNSTPRIWMKLFTKHWQFMSTLILPTGIILASSIITQIEFRNNTWKQVYTSPQKLSTIFWAKYMLVFFALFQFFLIFNLGIYLSAVLPALFFSDVSYPLGPFP